MTEAAHLARRAIGSVLQRWMTGMLLSMTAIGVLTALGLALLGIESWLVLGALCFMLEFVPYLGPMVASLPGIAPTTDVFADEGPLWGYRDAAATSDIPSRNAAASAAGDRCLTSIRPLARRARCSMIVPA